MLDVSLFFLFSSFVSANGSRSWFWVQRADGPAFISPARSRFPGSGHQMWRLWKTPTHTNILILTFPFFPLPSKESNLDSVNVTLSMTYFLDSKEIWGKSSNDGFSWKWLRSHPTPRLNLHFWLRKQGNPVHDKIVIRVINNIFWEKIVRRWLSLSHFKWTPSLVETRGCEDSSDSFPLSYNE